MIRYILGGFLILHGVVHLLYTGQSWRFFELHPGMVWPDGSWAFARLLGNHPTRVVASVALVVAAIGLIAGGLAVLLGQPLWQPVTVASLAFSGLLYIVLWNGKMEQLDNQGGVGLLINIGLLIALLVFRWPRFAL